MKKEDITCPTCQKPHTWTPENSTRPFCSERCKLIDLGSWAAEDHKIPGEETINPDDTSHNPDQN